MLAFLPGGVGPFEMMMFGVIALLLFGKRLPEVARSLGKGMTEFKRGIRGVEDEFKSTMNTRPRSQPARRPDPVDDEREEWTAPPFEPPTSAPSSAADRDDAGH
ncbi:MAG: twin-arginine translocase TatA/TatE family subunit [Planctomycetaceae bacterium]